MLPSGISTHGKTDFRLNYVLVLKNQIFVIRLEA